MHVERFFLCVVLTGIVFFGTHLNCPDNVGDCDSPRLVFDRSYPFLDHLANDFFCLSSPFGVVSRFLYGLSCDSSWSLVVIVLSLGRLVVVFEKGRVEGCRRVGGLILVCLVSVHCVFVPVEFVATLLFCFFAVFLIVEFVICWYFDS